MRLRCEGCNYNPTGNYCQKLKHPLENSYAKLFHGGAIGNYGVERKIKYSSQCKIEGLKHE